MKTRIVLIAGASTLILAGALVPCSAQDNPAKPPAAPQADEKALDELDEVRVREDVLKMDLQNNKTQLQQWVQMTNQMKFQGLRPYGKATDEENEQREVALKRAEKVVTELESAYLATTRELSRTSRRRTALETRIPAPAVVGGVKADSAKPEDRPFIKADGVYINPRQVSHVIVDKDENGEIHVQIVSAAGVAPLFVLKGKQAESLIEALDRNSR